MALNYIIIGKRIQKIRKQRHLSQEYVSEQIERSKSYICYVENATRFLSLEALVEIANYFEVSVDVLLGDNLKYNEADIRNELAEVFRDCSEYEKKLILDIAKEIKRSHRAHRPLK